MVTLPIEAVLDDLSAALKKSRSVVLEAPPGAGKTTRVPPRLLSLVEDEVWVLEPRRLAARMAARRIAEERGEKVGELVGYQVRFDERSGPRTRLRFVTEAILTRRLIADPSLRGISAVVLDEFHERHIHTDVALALLRQAQRGPRKDLLLVVMSATLDSPALAAYLDAPVVRSEGRLFPIEIAYAPSEQPLQAQVAHAVRAALDDPNGGDVLVFLPGAADIARAIEASRPETGRALLLPLYGELTSEQQDRAVAPAGKRKVVFATNVAETSITVFGVGYVIDSGLAKHAAHAPWSGLPTLKTGKVSQASAIQRAGRAGRTRAGVCVRLYSEPDFRARPAFTPPEIRRIDLAETALLLADKAVSWFEAPSESSWTAALDLLRQLGAIDASDRCTALGSRMRELPLHPRQARLLLCAQALGRADEGCALAALLAERDFRSPPVAHAVESDLLVKLDIYEQARERFAGIDRVRAQLRRMLPPGRATTGDRDEALRLAILLAFPDRVGKIRQSPSGEKQIVFAQGSHGVLSRESAVHAATWVVAVDAEERVENGRTLIRVSSASAISADWILEHLTSGVEDEEVSEWNDAAKRVDSHRRLRLGQLVLEETRTTGDPARVAEALFAAAKRRGYSAFADHEALDQLVARVSFLRQERPDLQIFFDPERVLSELCVGRRSFAELEEANFIAACEASLGSKLREFAPPELALPSGRKLRVNYVSGQAPWVASRLQDFFGMAKAPLLAGGGIALVIHLLAPNGRAVQVTSDLAGFWREHYPSLAQALRRRYPRHAWPDDPLHAAPPRPKR